MRLISFSNKLDLTIFQGDNVAAFARRLCSHRNRFGPAIQRHLWFIKYFSITCSIWNRAFAKFKSPEWTRLHLREIQSQKFFRRSMRPKLPRKVRDHITTVYYIFRRPLSQNPPSAPEKCRLCICFCPSVIIIIIFRKWTALSLWWLLCCTYILLCQYYTLKFLEDK